jgi:peptidoglycan/LPS O-acetylase OafA/YrhL
MLVLTSHFVDPNLIPGGLGVLVFFVISGFLITRLMFLEWASAGVLDIKGFYLRRFWRLYPAVVAYSITVVVVFLMVGKSVYFVAPLSALFYFANYIYGIASLHGYPGHMPFQTFWSLSVEEHFYWIFPLIFVFAARARSAWLVSAMIFVSVLCLLARVLILIVWPWVADTSFIYFSDLRLDSIAFGVIIASLCEWGFGRRVLARLSEPSAVAVACLGLAISLLWRAPVFRESLRYSLEAASVAVLLSAILFSPRYRLIQIVLNSAPIVWIGVLSYSLYVWHPFANLAVQAVLPSSTPRPIEIALLFVTTFGMSAISYYAMESPLRSYFFRGRSTSG